MPEIEEEGVQISNHPTSRSVSPDPSNATLQDEVNHSKTGGTVPQMKNPKERMASKSFSSSKKWTVGRTASNDSAVGRTPSNESQTQTSTFDPKQRMAAFKKKFSQSTKFYTPTEIEVPEQLVMEQDGLIYVIDLGYTRITVGDAEVEDKRLRTQIIIACCPCCINGPKAAVMTFFEMKAYKTFTFVISIVDIIFFCVEMGVYGVEDLGDNKLIGPSACGLYSMGAKWTPDIVLRGEVWRLFSPIVLHAGFVHIGLNLFAQLSVGMQCEFTWGTKAVIAIYLMAGLVGNILSALGSPESLSVGASGAILGLVGGQITHTWITWGNTNAKLRVGRMRGLVVTIVILVGTGFLGPVDNLMHFGGLIAGVLTGLLLFRCEAVYSGWKRFFAQTTALFGFVLIILLTVLLFVEQRDDFRMDICP